MGTEKCSSDAPVWYGAEEASAWAAGYNEAADETKRLRAALEKIASPNQPPRVGFGYARQIAQAALTGREKDNG